ELSRFGGSFLSQAVDRVQPPLHVLGRLAKELWHQALAEKPTSQPLGIQKLPISEDGGIQLQLAILNRVNLTLGPIQIAGKGEEFEQEKPLTVVSGFFFDLFELGID